MSSLPSASKIIFDPIHKYMNLSSICVQIIDTPVFKRLKYLHQLSLCYQVFPGATHKRFEHSLGVAYLSGKLMRSLQKHQPELEITAQDIKLIEVAGLCHDLGHGPFSHLWDHEVISQLVTNPKEFVEHETRSCLLLDVMKQTYHIALTQEEIEQVKRYIHPGPKDIGFRYQIVANLVNGIDVDKFDYLCRDTYNIGLEYTYDYSRIIRQARVIDDMICYPHKIARDLYLMFYTRYKLHREIYNHPVVKAIEYMVSECLLLVNDIFHFLEKTISLEFVHFNDYILEIIKHYPEDLLTVEQVKRLRKAKQILYDIDTRKLYRCIGELQFPILGDHKTVIETIQTKILNEFIQYDSTLSRQDFIVQKVYLGYEQLDKNPLESIYFYKVQDLQTKYKLHERDRQNYLPKEMEIVSLRFYSKNSAIPKEFARKIVSNYQETIQVYE